jgi:hypothetical protein
MRRWLRHFVAATSLLLLLSVCVLWVRSHFVAVEVSICEGEFPRNPLTIGLGSGRGMMWVRRYRVFGDGAPSRVFVQRTGFDAFSGEPPSAGVSVADAPVDGGDRR